MSKHDHNFATTRNPLIQAVVKGLYRFKKTSDAKAVLDGIRTQFTLAKQQPEEAKDRCVIIWIEGFKLSKSEKEEGYKGHYALVSYHKTEDKLFYTITSEKLDTDLKYHPKRNHVNERMPNWGHPILRAIKKGKVYADKQEAMIDLQKLQVQYPTTSVPGTNKLLLMIFSRKADAKNPVSKHVLDIVPNKEGEGFIIVEKKRNFQSPNQKSVARKIQSTDVPVGYFTQMLASKRKR